MAQSSLASGAAVVGMAGMYICLSAGLINFNKYLMNEERFPFSMALVLTHMVVGTALSSLSFLLAPSLFSSLTDPAKKVTVDRSLFATAIVPIALCFSVQLVCTNTAYLYCSVAFLQMMKEANLVFVYCMSLVAGLEFFHCRHLQVIAFCLGATALTVHGEMHFSAMGFAIQASGQIFESSRIVLQSLALSSTKLDAMTYQLLVAPTSMVVLAVTFLTLNATGIDHVPMPSAAVVQAWWPVVLLNACVAFALNLAINFFVKNSSAVAFILAGLVKDASVVTVSAVFFGESVSHMQQLGFSMQLVAVFAWSMIKTFPEHYDRRGVLLGTLRIFEAVTAKQEKTPLPTSTKDSSYGAAGLLDGAGGKEQKAAGVDAERH